MAISNRTKKWPVIELWFQFGSRCEPPGSPVKVTGRRVAAGVIIDIVVIPLRFFDIPLDFDWKVPVVLDDLNESVGI